MRIKANNVNNWVEVWQLPIPPSQNQYKDIVLCPIILTSPLIAVNFISIEAEKFDWKVAGYVNQQIQTAIPITNSRAVTQGGCKVFFNKLQIISFLIQSEYLLEFSINSWVRQGGSLQVWEYVGEIVNDDFTSTAEQLQLQNQIAELNAILDSLQSTGLQP